MPSSARTRNCDPDGETLVDFRSPGGASASDCAVEFRQSGIRSHRIVRCYADVISSSSTCKTNSLHEVKTGLNIGQRGAFYQRIWSRIIQQSRHITARRLWVTSESPVDIAETRLRNSDDFVSACYRTPLKSIGGLTSLSRIRFQNPVAPVSADSQ